MDILDLLERTKGDRPTADEWNAIVSALQRVITSGVPHAAVDPNREQDNDSYVCGYSEDTSPPQYGISGFSGKDTGSAGIQPQGFPLSMLLGKVNGNSRYSPLVPVVNSTGLLRGQTASACRIVGAAYPELVLAGRPFPKVGHPCGLQPGTWTACAGYGGLVCLGLYSTSDADYAMVVAQAGATTLIGKAHGTINERVGDCFGGGKVDIYYLHNNANGSSSGSHSSSGSCSGDWDVMAARDPSDNTSKWTLDVVNSFPIDIGDGCWCGVTPAVGFGLMVSPLC